MASDIVARLLSGKLRWLVEGLSDDDDVAIEQPDGTMRCSSVANLRAAADEIPRLTRELSEAQTDKAEAVRVAKQQTECIAELEDQLSKTQSKLRCIISHATGGSCSDASLPLNEIAVIITQHVNTVWTTAQAEAEARLARMQSPEMTETLAKMLIVAAYPNRNFRQNPHYDEEMVKYRPLAAAIQTMLGGEGE